MNLEEKLYTSTEVAQILGVSLRSVYRYLDEGKLDAEVKTATGRHRFTKKNILDFLYPNGEKPTPQNIPTSSDLRSHTTDLRNPQVSRFSDISENSAAVSRGNVSTSVTTGTSSSTQSAGELDTKRFEIEEKFNSPKDTDAAKTPDSDLEEDSEPIDWLAKFREAAKKFREDEEKQTQNPAPQAPSKEPPKEEVPVYNAPKSHVETFTSLGNQYDAPKSREKEFEQAPKTRAEKEFFYYRSMIGGLKDIAQNIDKNARKSGLNYAFTRSAGLSLHKPIRPFSLLHAYVASDDREFFERALHLVPSDENNAQLCLVSTENKNVFNSKKEMHNLYVVSDSQLRKDLSEAGDDDLVVELDSVLGF